MTDITEKFPPNRPNRLVCTVTGLVRDFAQLNEMRSLDRLSGE